MRTVAFLAMMLLVPLAAQAKDISITPKHLEKVNVRVLSDLAHALDACLALEKENNRCEQQRDMLAEYAEEDSIRRLEVRSLQSKGQKIKVQKRQQKDFSRKKASKVTGADRSKVMATVDLGEPK